MRKGLRRVAVGVSFFALFGCVARPSAELVRAQQQMTARDYTGTLTSADAAIAKDPAGPNTAKAYYLKGQAIEKLSSNTPAEAKDKLQQARTAYIAALKADGSHGPLEGIIRASLANVSYWQEDYTTAAQQGLAAAPLLVDPTDAAWTLYRAGLSQQRLGQFSAADKSFALAIARGPGTDPAIRAQSHKGIRGFNVRILFDGEASAVAATKDFAQRRLLVVRKNKTQGAEVELLVGNFGNYAAALTTRQQLLNLYPNAVVVP